jgi:Lipocalin-like domain
LLRSLAILLLFGAVSCNITTANDPAPSGTSKLELIAGKISKSWEVTAISVDGVDAFTLNKICSKDDIFMLNAAKSYEINEGVTKCRTADLQVYEKGTWDLSTDQSEVVLNGKTRYKILELTSSTMRLSSKNLPGEVIEKTYRVQSSN